MMEWLLLAYFAISFLLVLGLGYYQAKLEEHEPQDGFGDPGLYGVLALASIVGLALAVLICLGGTPWFPLGALFVGFTLLCHHMLIHWNSRFEGETCSCAPFQCKDVENHETWVVAAITAAVVSWLQV
jgi:hypothetical protein